MLDDYSLNFPAELFDFFDFIEANEVAFNIAERDGNNTSVALNAFGAKWNFTKFLSSYFARHLSKHYKHRIRELETGLEFILQQNISRNNSELHPAK